MKIAFIYSVNPEMHYSIEKGVAFLSVYDPQQSDAVHYPVNVVDSDPTVPVLPFDTYYVNDKRLFDKHFKDVQAFDISTQVWLKTNTKSDELLVSELYRQYIKFYSSIIDSGRYIPASKYREISYELYSKVLDYLHVLEISDASLFYRDKVYPALEKIEDAGLCIDLSKFNQFFNKGYTFNMVHCRYRLHTTTGRPSNTFDHINYSALNKQDGSRSSFISRFGQSGMLLEFDLDAYHLRLISQIIGYDLPDESVHEYFGRKYFNVEELTDEQYSESKSISFRLLYGSIPPEYEHVEFFKKVEEFKSTLWDTFTANGEIYSPISKKKLTVQMFPGITSSKLFNYLLQTVETEYSIIFIEEIHNLLTKRKSKLILYTYDSFLIDYNLEDGVDIFYELSNLLKNSRLRVGYNYHDVHLIDLPHLLNSRLDSTKNSRHNGEKATTTMHIY